MLDITLPCLEEIFRFRMVRFLLIDIRNKEARFVL